jgi:hypothetical protein
LEDIKVGGGELKENNCPGVYQGRGRTAKSIIPKRKKKRY